MLNMMMRAESVRAQDAPRQFKSRNRRQVDVEHADIGLFGDEHPLAAFGVGGFQDRDIVVAGEQRAATRSHDRMIIDDQNTHRRWSKFRVNFCCVASD